MAVWRSTCGDTSLRVDGGAVPRLVAISNAVFSASATARAKAFLTLATGLPSYSTTAWRDMPLSRQRRKCVRRRAGRESNGRLALVGRRDALALPIEHARVQVSESLAFGRGQSGSADSGRARPGIKANQNKSSDVLARPAIGRLPLLDLTIAPGRPYQPGSLARERWLTRSDRHPARRQR